MKSNIQGRIINTLQLQGVTKPRPSVYLGRYRYLNFDLRLTFSVYCLQFYRVNLTSFGLGTCLVSILLMLFMSGFVAPFLPFLRLGAIVKGFTICLLLQTLLGYIFTTVHLLNFDINFHSGATLVKQLPRTYLAKASQPSSQQPTPYFTEGWEKIYRYFYIFIQQQSIQIVDISNSEIISIN